MLSFFTVCNSGKFEDRDAEKQADKITQLLDSSSIQIFHTWNYGTRGEYEIWTKLSGDSYDYACFYQMKKDTSYLKFYQPYLFARDFPCSLSLDTSKFWQFNFDMYKGNIFRITFTDRHGQDHVTDTLVPVNKIFTEKSPFDTLSKLSALKERLGVYGIVYQKDIGEFIEFWLSSLYELRYLPDSLHLEPKYEKYWLADFAAGRMIKKNWNLRKYEERKGRD